jgi:hypothetical protein
MTDYTPKATKEDIDRIIARDYPKERSERVWEILNLYGYGEAFRVYAAALKEGRGDIERLKMMIDLANLDYRDLLAAAEYPAQMKDGDGCHDPQSIRSDEKQYYDWFNK